MGTTKLITLAISEVRHGSDDFNIIAIEIRNQKIIPIHVAKEEIISQSGEVFWDIGFLTAIKGNIKKQSDKDINSPYIIDGSTLLLDNRIGSLKALLEAKASSPETFFNNERLQFCIVKINKVSDIKAKKKDESIDASHYISVYIKGLPAHNNPVYILNKDYRWVKYWNWIYNNGEYVEKRDEYLQLLNRKDKSLYLILYRHHFKNGPRYWIAGIHWL